MECYRCNKCNYNLCDQCFITQVEDYASPSAPPYWPRPQSGTSASPSIPQSIDELLSRSNDDPWTLPRIPPAFSRGLSSPPSLSPRMSSGPSSCANYRAGSKASTALSFISAPGRHARMKSNSKPASPILPFEEASSKSAPSQTYHTAAQFNSSRRSSSSSMGSLSRKHVDPMLRIVSLSEWIAESGLFAESLADYALAQRSGGDMKAAVQDLADVMVRGMAYGRAGSAGSRTRIDKASLEQMNMTARCRFLPLEDVHEDLKIWHLTLLRRMPRKSFHLQYGRVQKRPDAGFDGDPSLLGSFGNQDSAYPGFGEKLASGAAADHPGYVPGDWDPGSQSFGSGGRPGFFDPHHPDGRRSSGDGRFDSDDSALGPDGKPRGGDRHGTDTGAEEDELGSDGEPIGKDDQPGGRASRRGSTRSQGEDDDALTSEAGASRPGSGLTGDVGTVPGKRGDHARASVRSSVSHPGQPGFEEELDGFEGQHGEKVEETEEEREQRLLASGDLFTIKQVAAEVIMDEFANMLLPPPPLSSVAAVSGKDSRPQTPDGGSSITSGARTHRHAQQSPTMAFSSGMRSNLADDFRACIEEAFRLIDFPDETKKRKAEAAEVEEFLKDDVDDPSLQALLSRSTTNYCMQLKSDASPLLETHLRNKAEKHGKRLQLHGERATRSGKDTWPRRLQSCQQSMRMTVALDMFAESRAREKVGIV